MYGIAPDIVRPALAAQVSALCFEGYAVLHSGVSHTPLAVAEHLTRARMAAARETRREGNFHEEDRLSGDERARLADYARSGSDRGHMAPAGDMGTATSMAESFSLANIVPRRTPARTAASGRHRDLGPQPGCQRERRLRGHRPGIRGRHPAAPQRPVPVPTSLFKAVYIPRRGAAAYVVENAPGMAWRAVSMSELRQIAGIEVFPGLAAATRDRVLTLPEPQPNNVRGACERQDKVASTGPGSSTQARRTNPTAPASPTQQAQSSGWSRSALIVGSVFVVVVIVLLIRVLGRR